MYFKFIKKVDLSYPNIIILLIYIFNINITLG